LPLRLFKVVGDSMRPTLGPGDVLIALRGGEVRRGQLRLFRDPRLSTRWMVKRVSDVFDSTHGAIFEFRSDNPAAPGAAGSDELGWVSVAGSYRVWWPPRTGGNR
jgi:phage repressor protein C with HTH and peptisase S24 domain